MSSTNEKSSGCSKRDKNPRNEESSPRRRFIKKKIFVGGIPWDISSEDLHTEFSKYGKVDNAFVIRDKSGSSRGFGFVEFNSPQVAQTIIDKRTIPLGSRYVECKESAARKEATTYDERRVMMVMKNLADEEKIKKSLEQFGAIEHSKSKGRNLYITFSSRSGVEKCIKRGKLLIDGTWITISKVPSEPKTEDPKRASEQTGRLEDTGKLSEDSVTQSSSVGTVDTKTDGSVFTFLNGGQQNASYGESHPPLFNPVEPVGSRSPNSNAVDSLFDRFLF